MKPREGGPDLQNGCHEEPKDPKMMPKRPPEQPQWSQEASRRSKDRRTSPAVGFTNLGGGGTSKLVQPIADDARHPKDRQTSTPLGGASAVAGSQLCCAWD